ncbi:hypothetical protein RRG08_013252 [Elysia crispata]|uniref:Laccase n=1 Tax=Elysia crispata TaxID=231223 RepID=A0AAE0ZVK1_9GAST|nr:hypothetical protein RRG08_013252 [Elysia crispata]
MLISIASNITNISTVFYFSVDYKNHPCNRPCEGMAPPRLCQYKWVVESYWTLSKACHNCPFNESDCFRPHCIATDGVERGIISVNRILPGPAIEVCEGDMIEVKVKNELSNAEGTSIHWHGLLQKGTPHMDGVSLLTQCPISARSSFTYRFKALDPGTHYWHGHTGMQRADGLFGAIVVRQPPNRDPHYALYDHDLSEHVIIVNDWLNRMTLAQYLAHHHNDGDNMPSLMLINGMGAYEEFKDGNTTYYTPRASFTVQGGKKYRFRVISNAVFECPIQISVDGHTLTVIASDGGPIEPFTADSFHILSGERYDFILYADKTTTLRNYWIRARGMVLCGFKKAHQVAVLHYAGAPDVDPPEPTDWDSSIRGGILLNPWNGPSSDNEVEITRMRAELPDENDGVLTSVPDKKFYMGMLFNRVDSLKYNNPDLYPLSVVVSKKRILSPQINFISSKLPASPPLSQYNDIPKSQYCNEFTVQTDCSKEWCSCTHKVDVSLGDLVELVVIDQGLPWENSHPIHIHGFKFRAVAMGKMGTSTSFQAVKELDKQGNITRSTVRAPYKDSITVPDGGYVVLRFRADNPGMWLLHCHVQSHSDIGMGVIIQVGDKSEFPKPPKNFPRCGSWDGEYGDDDDDDDNDGDDEHGNPPNKVASQAGVFLGMLVALTCGLSFWNNHIS